MGNNYFKATVSLILLTFLSFSSLVAQNISGVVTDENGEALPGATIVIVGTTNGTTTDFDGKYSIDISSETEKISLRASFIGYQEATHTFNAGSNQTWNISLHNDTVLLNDVVVVGYGVQKKSDKTGAVASVKASELNTGVVTDPIQGLQGKTPGVQISKKGGDPNAGFSIKIRGSSGLASDTDPLYVVDGIPGVDPTTIGPDDIESFNVLKDASSAAIYGSRGANGVILITTKKGNTDGSTTIDFNMYTSMDVVAKRFNLLNATQLRKHASDNNLNFSDNKADTDWQNEIFRTGRSQSYNLAFAGGTKDFNYRASVSHLNFKGVIQGSDKIRDIARVNMAHTAIDNKLTISANISATIEHNNYVDYSGNGFKDVIFQTLQRNPTDPVYNKDGSYNRISRFNYANPVALVNEIQNERDAKRYSGNLKADFEIIKGLKAGVNLGYIRNDHESFYFVPSYSESTATQGEAKRSYDNFESRLFESTLSYNNSFAEVNNINAILGYSYQIDMNTSFSARGEGPVSDLMKSNNLGSLAILKLGDITSYKGKNKLISFFGRVAYNYDSKYYITGTFRRDGSSKFGNNNQWGIFPSGSIAWDLSKENFLNNVDFLDQLKIRAGYGLTGNQEIDRYLAVNLVGITGQGIEPSTGNPVPVMGQNRNANPDLKWESNSELNIGIDFAFLDSRLSGSIEYYTKRTYDLLAEYQVSVPPYKYDKMFANAGEIKNKGIELFLEAFIVDKENIDWKSSLSFSKNKQEMVSLSDSKFNLEYIEKGWISGPGLVGVSTQRIAPGMTFGTFYGYKSAGISTDGEWVFYDRNKKLRTFDQLDPNKDKQILGSALPDFEIGWSNYLTIYKNFDMSFALRGVYGQEVLNITKMIFANPAQVPTNNGLIGATEMYGKLKDAPIFSDYYLESASFIRLENLTIGYKFNANNIKLIRKARLFFTINNAFVLTSYSGVDPEMSYGSEEPGIDQYNVYPKIRSFTLGFNVGF